MRRSLQRSNLPLGAKASAPQTVETYEFYKDPKDSKVFWDFRKVRRWACAGWVLVGSGSGGWCVWG